MIATLGVQRKEVAIFFDLNIFHGDVKPIAELPPDVIEKIRRFVRKFPINKDAQMELGKCCALVEQLSQ